jgi:hypothetical protein
MQAQEAEVLQATSVLKEEKWAIFTEWKLTGYISNGPYAYTEERARELLLYYINTEDEEEKKNIKNIKKMWIQEKNTGKTLYIMKK